MTAKNYSINFSLEFILFLFFYSFNELEELLIDIYLQPHPKGNIKSFKTFVYSLIKSIFIYLKNKTDICLNYMDLKINNLILEKF